MTILIVDDDALLRELFAEGLGRRFKVVTAANGNEALAILRATPGIQLLLSDIRMPEMNGFDLAEAALAHDPELKIIFMTGYHHQNPPASLLRAREMRTLYKPFDFATLVQLVEQMLSRP